MPLSEAQLAEIQAQQAQSFTTKRPTVEALENILYEALPVLDHGFIRTIDYMGDDSAIVQAARVSYGKGTKKVNTDTGLIRYLLRHWHTTPFEMCEIKFHIKLPIFIARQWIRHRTANVNEYSARYSIMDREFYIPKMEHLAAQAANNRQGRGDTLQGQEAEEVLKLLKDDAQQCYDHYEYMLNMNQREEVLNENRTGLARELARMNLTLNTYTQWYWKTDLHNLMHFCRLRADSHAQYEIRAYADILIDIMRKWVPATHQAFLDYRHDAMHLSGQGLAVIKRLLAGKPVTQETSGLTVREWNELQESLT